MGSTKQAVDTRTFQRLRARRLLVVDAHGDRAEAFARALRQNGAAAVAISPDATQYAAAHALDVEAMLVNEDEAEVCRPLVIALRSHPRTRWATVLPNSFSALWPDGAEQPDVAAIANEVNRHVAHLMELSVRARGKLPYETAIEPLGPNRILRVLDNTGRRLRVVFSDARVSAELELGEQRVSGVRAVQVDDERPLVDIEALAAALALQAGQLRIEESTESKRTGWTATLPAALEAAAALACARATGDREPPAASGVRPAVSAGTIARGPIAAAPERNIQPTVPQIVLSEVWNEPSDIAFVAEMDVDLPAVEERPSSRPTVEVTAAPSVPPMKAAPIPARADTSARPARKRRVAVIAIGIMAASAALAVSSWGGRLVRPRSAPQRAAAPAAPSPSSHVALPAVPAAQPAAEPQTAAAGEASAENRPAPEAARPERRQPTASELKQARRVASRGHRYLRAGRHETAAMAYLKALAIAPDYAPAMTALVRVYLDHPNPPEALRWAERLVAIDPESGTNQLLLGDARAQNGDQAGAAEAWRHAGLLGNSTAAKRLAPR